MAKRPGMAVAATSMTWWGLASASRSVNTAILCCGEDVSACVRCSSVGFDMQVQSFESDFHALVIVVRK
jgi:hypothetical protein